jgi:hypothetical protein
MRKNGKEPGCLTQRRVLAGILTDMTSVQIVKADLEWLAKAFGDGTDDRDELRRSSAVVRRLLVDGLLQQARKEAGATGQPTLDIYPLSQILDMSHLGEVTLVAAMGWRIGSRQLGPSSFGEGDLPALPEPIVVASITLPRFLGAPCLVTHGHSVTRRQVIKYVANKMGGVHFDTRRNRAGDDYIEYLERLDDFMIFEPIGLVDSVILSIIQALVSSHSVMEPFRLAPIEFDLDVPLERGNQAATIPARAWAKVNFMGDESG